MSEKLLILNCWYENHCILITKSVRICLVTVTVTVTVFVFVIDNFLSLEDMTQEHVPTLLQLIFTLNYTAFATQILHLRSNSM